MKLFISYARSDGADSAQKLRQDLSASGYDLWQDISDMRAGSEWRAQLADALKEVAGVLLLLTPNSVTSEAVRWEWETALYVLAKPVYSLLILPCDVPAELNRQHYHNLHEDYSGGLLKLLRDLRELEATSSPAQQSPPAGGHSYTFHGKVSGQNQVFGNQTIHGNQNITQNNPNSTDQSAVEQIIAAIEAQHISAQEAQTTLLELRAILTNIDKQRPEIQNALERLTDDRLTQAEAREVLKLTVPIIPFVLSYEHELELGQRTSLQRIWGFLRGKT